jgi:hypothetical protein
VRHLQRITLVAQVLQLLPQLIHRHFIPPNPLSSLVTFAVQLKLPVKQHLPASQAETINFLRKPKGVSPRSESHPASHT